MDKRILIKKSSGFTIIEFLVYLALFGFIFSGLFAAVFAITETMGKNDARIMARFEGEFLLAKIEREKDITAFENIDGTLMLAGRALNNSQTAIGDFEIVDLQNGLARAKFVLTAKDRAGKDFSQDFLMTYYLPK